MWKLSVSSGLFSRSPVHVFDHTARITDPWGTPFTASDHSSHFPSLTVRQIFTNFISFHIFLKNDFWLYVLAESIVFFLNASLSVKRRAKFLKLQYIWYCIQYSVLHCIQYSGKSDELSMKVEKKKRITSEKIFIAVVRYVAFLSSSP